ncbi:NAD dependent epimerase/dehydratase family protein [Morchella snyderi]|nr:NAD dependent epimerase/dehydratase family protein [Morchella snyderi]
MPTAIVTGATGINGLALIRALSADPKTWAQIYAVSRSAPSVSTFPANVQHVPLDLLGCVADIAKLLKQRINEPSSDDAIYVFFAAYLEKETEEEQSDVNGALLCNFLEGLREAGLEKRLKRVVLTTGAKYYGAHHGAVKVPCEEEDPKVVGPTVPRNFYYVQEDILIEMSRDQSWDWCTAMPGAVIGFAHGNFMNLASAVAVYASVCKELGEPLHFTGNLFAYTTFDTHSSAKLTAEFEVWAALNEKCHNERFNIVNGDQASWQTMWPKIARHFGVRIPPNQFAMSAPLPGKYKLPHDPPLAAHADKMGLVGVLEENAIDCRVDLVQWAEREDVKKAWAGIARREGLKDDALERGTWAFANWILAKRYPWVSSMTKARKLGWTGYIDTWECLEDTFNELEQEKVIPRPQSLIH